jgi:Tfp pilus assembly protein PilN
MNEINFLPQSFLETQNRRLRLFREVVILSGMILISLALFAGQSGRVASVKNLVEQKTEELEAAKLRSQEVARLSSEQQKLKLQLAVHEGLAMPLNPSTILAAISEVLPERMALTEVSISADEPKLDLTSLKSGNKTKTVSKTKVKVTKPVLHFMDIQLMGLSPSDVDVANLVGALSASPIFQNVKMRYSKSTRMNKATAREFRLEMEIPMDCIYEDVTPSTASSQKEVAHVD